MKQIKIADCTLCAEKGVFGFKEKLEIARQLERLKVDVIEIPEIANERADILFVRTTSSLVKNSVLSVAAGSDRDSVRSAITSLSSAEKGRVRIEVPLSTVGMEYISRRKPGAMLQWIGEALSMVKEAGIEAEFCAVDATRAEKEFIFSALDVAVSSGADFVSVCDSAAEMLPDDFSQFVKEIVDYVKIPVGVRCSNKNGLSVASSILSVRAGAETIKTDVSGVFSPLETVGSLLRDCGNHYRFSVGIRQTELRRITKQISWICNNVKNENSAMTLSGMEDASIFLDANDDQNSVDLAVAKLGYDLSEEDKKRVYEEFIRVAGKKQVGSKELEAIVASVALQVPATFQLVSYVVNNGNIISSTAQISLSKNDTIMQSVCLGAGPVDAAFRAIDQIIGHHYELDDFQIQSVTEGKEAMGSALVKLRSGGKLYSGNGISTDIIGASIRAYLNAVNKIVYEEV